MSTPNETMVWLSPSAVAEVVGISRATLYRHWQAGTGPRYSQVGARRRCRPQWVQDWLLEMEVAA